jgi:hypothetical protein
MAINLKSVNSTPSSTARTLVYTCPATGVLDSTIFAGTIANNDTTGLATYSVTIERLLVDGTTYVPKLVNIPIAFGGSLTFPKMSLAPSEKLYMKSSTANMLTTDISLAERT